MQEGDEQGPRDARAVTVLLDVRGVEVPIGEVREWRRPDLDQVEALARLALQARSNGWTVRLKGPCGRMVELLEMFGLGGIVVADEQDGQHLRLAPPAVWGAARARAMALRRAATAAQSRCSGSPT